jgi:hypothetical protein
MSILPWRAWRSWPVTNAHGTKPPGENLAIDRVAITDDVLRRPRNMVFEAEIIEKRLLPIIKASHHADSPSIVLSKESQKPNKNNDIQRISVSFMRAGAGVRHCAFCSGTFSPTFKNYAPVGGKRHRLPLRQGFEVKTLFKPRETCFLIGTKSVNLGIRPNLAYGTSLARGKTGTTLPKRSKPRSSEECRLKKECYENGNYVFFVRSNACRRVYRAIWMQSKFQQSYQYILSTGRHMQSL